MDKGGLTRRPADDSEVRAVQVRHDGVIILPQYAAQALGVELGQVGLAELELVLRVEEGMKEQLLVHAVLLLSFFMGCVPQPLFHTFIHRLSFIHS